MQGGTALLLETAMAEAQTRGQLEVGQPIFSPMASALLDQRQELEHDAEIVQPNAWGWHEARFAVLPDGDANAYQVALLDVYHDALTGDLAGEYLSISQHSTVAEAEQARDGLIERAFDKDARQVAEGVVENLAWSRCNLNTMPFTNG